MLAYDSPLLGVFWSMMLWFLSFELADLRAWGVISGVEFAAQNAKSLA